MPTHAYKFAHHDNVPTEPPDGSRADTAESAWSETPLTRDQKDALANLLWGTFGSHRSEYREAGWAWPLRSAPRMVRILVRFPNESTFQAYYAPDKTSLRRALYGAAKAEMIVAPVRR